MGARGRVDPEKVGKELHKSYEEQDCPASTSRTIFEQQLVGRAGPASLGGWPAAAEPVAEHELANNGAAVLKLD